MKARRNHNDRLAIDLARTFVQDDTLEALGARTLGA
jgi:hypothetical protein